MDLDLINEFQESQKERAEIQQKLYERDKKDQRLIRMYCADNEQADVMGIIFLLEKRVADRDKEILEGMRTFPNELSVEIILEFEDLKEIYKDYLESGGEEDV